MNISARRVFSSRSPKNPLNLRHLKKQSQFLGKTRISNAGISKIKSDEYFKMVRFG